SGSPASRPRRPSSSASSPRRRPARSRSTSCAIRSGRVTTVRSAAGEPPGVPPLHVLRVFVGDGGAGGNPLGVFLDGGEVPERDRQVVAAELGFSETVFVEDPGQGRLRIFTPKEELPFAGHPLVGTAWLLTSEGFDVSALHPPAGEVPVRVEGVVTFISGRPEWAPQLEHIELSSSTEVEELAGPPDDHDLAGAWAWEEDEEVGYVRARVFPVRLSIKEGETTGA